MSYHYNFKLIVTGDSGVGKTSLVQQFTRKNYNFDNTHHATIGVDFGIQNSDIEYDDKIYKIKSQIWDTAGQEAFRSIISSYYRNSAGILLVFDLGNKNSFSNISYWFNKIKGNNYENSVIFLIGNKNDTSNRQVSFSDANDFAKLNNISYIETTARNKLEVNELFKMINKKILDKVLNDEEILGVTTPKVNNILVEKKNRKCLSCNIQ